MQEQALGSDARSWGGGQDRPGLAEDGHVALEVLTESLYQDAQELAGE